MKIEKEKLESLIRESVAQHISSLLNEAADEKPSEGWSSFGEDVDELINSTIDECNKLIEKGQEMMEEDIDPSQDKKKVYISTRLGFLKALKSRLAQKFEGLRRNT